MRKSCRRNLADSISWQAWLSLVRCKTESPRSCARFLLDSRSKHRLELRDDTTESKWPIALLRTRPWRLLVRCRFEGEVLISSKWRKEGNESGDDSVPKASSQSQAMEGNASSLVGSSAKTEPISKFCETLVHSKAAEGSSTRRRLVARIRASVAGPGETVMNGTFALSIWEVHLIADVIW